MTEQQTAPSEGEIDRISVNLSLRSSDGPNITLEQRYIGLQPIVVIEPADEQPDGVLVFDVLAVDLDQSDLVQLLELLLDTLRDGVATPKEVDALNAGIDLANSIRDDAEVTEP